MEIEIELPEEFYFKIDELKKEIQYLKENLQPKQAPKYYTRKEVAEMFNVDISTIHNWTVKGVLIAYQIGGRVFYKADDIENAIVEIKK